MQNTPMGNHLRLYLSLFLVLFLLPTVGIPQSTVLQRGDILVFALSTDLGSCGDFSGQDEISFVCMKELTPGTALDFTDNGWEKGNLDKWGESEGVIRATRVGAAIPAGTIITFRTTINGLFTAISPNEGWNFVNLSGSGVFDLSPVGDQLFIMQNGNWANPVGGDNATYSGDVLFGFSTTGGWITDGSQNQSNLYPYLDCFSLASSGGQSFKYRGSLLPGTKKEWVEQVKDVQSWDVYNSDCNSYYSWPSYSDGWMVMQLTGSFEKGLWNGNKSRDWFECDNWDDLTRPDETTDVIITNTAFNPVEINAMGSALCKDLLIESQEVTMLGDNPSIRIKGNLIVGGSGIFDLEQASGVPEIKLDGDMFVSGNGLQAQNATLVFNGAEKTISGDGVLKIGELQLGANVSVSLEGVDMEIAHTLFLNQNSKLLLHGSDITLNNPVPNAIIRFANSYIISETDPNNYSYVIWNIGDRVGDYTIPFGAIESGAVKDLTFKYSIQELGAGATMGAVKFATYPTNAQNQPMPPTVEHLTNDFGKNNSHHILDRFWVVENGIADVSYDVYPRLGYTFTYNDKDWNDPSNRIDEERVVPQRYNPINNTWQDWLYSSTALTSSNTLYIDLDDKNDFYDIWTLADDSDPLPIELISFSANCNDGMVDFKWTTASETNNNRFVVERSADGNSFEQVVEVEGSNNSNYVIDYVAIDEAPLEKVSYYRLKQIDYDGKTDYSDLVGFQPCSSPKDFNLEQVYFNENSLRGAVYSHLRQSANLRLYNSFGQLIESQAINVNEGYNSIDLPLLDVSQGIYYFSFDGEYNSATHSVFVQ